MGLDCRSRQVHSMSPAAWVAAAVLVLVLGTLSFILIGCQTVFPLDERDPDPIPECQPGEKLVGTVCVKVFANHYICQCDCTGFGQNATIAPTGLINVYDDPTTQNVIGQSAPINEGMIIGGPQQALLNGADETWWLVDFNSGADGWVVQSQISLVAGAPILSKPLDVCVVPEQNPNLPGGHTPSSEELDTDCSGRVFDHFTEKTNGTLPAGTECGCAVTAVATDWVAECDAACPMGEVCLLAGSDPERPTPDTLSTALFGPTSVCQVTEGIVTLTVGGYTPKSQPKVYGLMQIHGPPCPAGEPCRVGLSYQLSADPIEFEPETVLPAAVGFVDITMSGATEPGVITLTEPGVIAPAQSLGAGRVPAGTALTSVNGRRARSSDKIAAVIRNTQEAVFAVNWETKACRLSGHFGGQVRGAGGELLDITADVDINGAIVNQPPLAKARVASVGSGETLECASTAGTPVRLDASESTDVDNNIAFYIWRRGSDTGALVGDASAAATRNTTAPLGTTRYFVRVVDTEFASDTASVTVNVVDTTKPLLACNAPSTISPPDAAVSFRATATDSCGAPPPVVVSNVECMQIRPDGTLASWKACKVTTEGDTVTIANAGGVNGVIKWKAHAVDAGGNAAEQECQVNVVSQGKTK
jgi:hypothetical protein